MDTRMEFGGCVLVTFVTFLRFSGILGFSKELPKYIPSDKNREMSLIFLGTGGSEEGVEAKEIVKSKSTPFLSTTTESTKSSAASLFGLYSQKSTIIP